MDRGHLAEEIDSGAHSATRPQDTLAADDPARPPQDCQAGERFLFALALLLLALILLSLVRWVSLSWAATTCCLTYEGKSLGRLQTLCEDGTRAVHTYNKTLSRWKSTVTSASGKTCTGRLNRRLTSGRDAVAKPRQ
jgi:hypothetical protein